MVCGLIGLMERRAVHSFLYEGMMFPETRKRFLEGGGFCAHHFWLAKGIEEKCCPVGGIGLAILCEDLAGHALVSVRETAAQRPRTRFWGVRGNDQPHCAATGCMFCRFNRGREEYVLRALEGLRRENEFADMLRAEPFCFSHARAALQSWKDAGNRDWLINVLEEQYVSLGAGLREYIRKNTWPGRLEPRGDERNWLQRAIRMLVGMKEGV